MEFITYFIQSHSFWEISIFENPCEWDRVFRILKFWLNINYNF